MRVGDTVSAPVRVVRGDRTLPPGYDHPHASEAARRLAERGQILRVQVGSGVHGTAIGGQDDRDEMGICLEPPEFVTGLARVAAGVRVEAAMDDGAGADGSAGQPGTVRDGRWGRRGRVGRPAGHRAVRAVPAAHRLGPAGRPGQPVRRRRPGRGPGRPSLRGRQ